MGEVLTNKDDKATGNQANECTHVAKCNANVHPARVKSHLWRGLTGTGPRRPQRTQTAREAITMRQAQAVSPSVPCRA